MIRRIASASVVLFCAVTAHSAETLRQNVTPGVVYQFDQSLTMNMNLTINTGGQQMNMVQTVRQATVGKMEVIEAASGQPSKARISFTPQSGGTMEMMGQSQSLPFNLAGKTVTATVKDGVVSVDDPNADQMSKGAIDGLMKSDDGMFPDRPVNPGDEWNGTFAAGANMKPSLKIKFDRVSDVGGRRVAELSCQGTLDGNEQGMNMRGTIGGPVVVDLATGLVVKGAMAGDLVVEGATQQAGANMTVNGTAKLGMNVAGNVSGGNAVANVGGGANGPIAGPAPVAPVDNPLVGGPAPTAVDGTFSGDGLVMTVNGKSVRLELGANTFDGTITAQDATSFKGNFSHQGQSFDFNATLAGDTVNFITGQKTYRLKKQGANNPLG
jgi:hypothetical protein